MVGGPRSRIKGPKPCARQLHWNPTGPADLFGKRCTGTQQVHRGSKYLRFLVTRTIPFIEFLGPESLNIGYLAPRGGNKQKRPSGERKCSATQHGSTWYMMEFLTENDDGDPR